MSVTVFVTLAPPGNLQNFPVNLGEPFPDSSSRKHSEMAMENGASATKRLREEENGAARVSPENDKRPRLSNTLDSPHESSDSDSDDTGSRPGSGSINKSLYLETIQRSRLDFDFEKICSVSLSNINVYACLVCGKYFQGRGESSHAYFHSVNEDHHVFINFNTLKAYILPEGYEVTSSNLDDIKYVAYPTYTKEQVSKLMDARAFYENSYDLNHELYIPGFIGINNIKQSNDYANVVIHALAHVKPLRYFFLRNDFSKSHNSDANLYPELLKRSGILFRKIWNPSAFKPHVSPHDLLQYVSFLSKKRFTPDKQSDPFDFLNWYLNTLHLALGGSRTKPLSSIVQKVFQGKLIVESEKIAKSRRDATRESTPAGGVDDKNANVQFATVPFMFLSLDLPPAPLFRSDHADSQIPQTQLVKLLAKYDGVTTQELAGQRKRYQIEQLPPYLAFHIKRFSKDSAIDQVNPTVVSFQTTKLDMRPYVKSKDDETAPIYYNLVANISHELNITAQGENQHVWKIQLLNKATAEWIQIMDLDISKVRRELLFLNESYIQIWEKE